MRSIVLYLFTLLVVTVSIAVDGGNASSVSHKTPYRGQALVICNTVQDSHCHEAIKSLEASLLAALEKKFEQLTEALNKTSGKVSFSL